MVRHHQRPGRQRHELPGDEEGEGVVSQDDQVHAAEECRIERQHPARRLLMLAVADGKQAGTGAAEVHHHQKERAERVHAVVRADPWQADGEPHRRRGKRPRQQLDTPDTQDGEAGNKAYEIDEPAGAWEPLQGDAQQPRAQQDGHARERHGNRHGPSPSPSCGCNLRSRRPAIAGLPSLCSTRLSWTTGAD